MYDLRNFTMSQMIECGAALRKIGYNAHSMEEIATKVVRYLYEHLVDGQTDRKACALIRCFKTHSYRDLDKELQEFACKFLELPLSSDVKCLTLLGTAGDKAEWNSRKCSLGHKAIPLPSAEVLDKLPMIRNLIKQLGMEVNTVVKPDPKFLLDMEQRTYNVFHMPDALDSLYIPAQKEFIIPYGIKSVLGFGGLFSKGDMFVIIMFSKVPVQRETADLFRTLALNIKIALLPFEEAVFIGRENGVSTSNVSEKNVSCQPERPVLDGQVLGLEAKTWSLEQLLEAFEKIVLEQTKKLQQEITERAHVEKVLAQKAKELEHKNAELDEFSYMASHDLQEPSRKLLAFSGLLKRDLGDGLPERANKDLEFITDAAVRMQTLVQALLSLSRCGRSAMKREMVFLGKCADSALESLSMRVTETGAKVDREALPAVWGDRTLLTELYCNLINNALKFIKQDKKPEVKLTVEIVNGSTVFGVQDNGIGIKPEYAKQIFVPFKRLHNRAEYEGTGIGLAICRKIVERHDGKIWVESEPGQGAHFRFTLNG